MSKPAAVLLCAGSGTRVQGVADDMPKSLLSVAGQTIIHRALSQLNDAGVESITVIAGYESAQLADAVDEAATVVVWDKWQTSNNLWTLAGKREVLETGDDIVVLFGDVLLAPGVLARVINAQADVCLAVDLSSRLDGTMRVRVDRGHLSIGNHVSTGDCDGNFIGVLKLSARAARRLAVEIADRLMSGRNRSDYYTVVLPEILDGLSLEYLDIATTDWAEVDTAADLEMARDKFAPMAVQGNK